MPMYRSAPIIGDSTGLSARPISGNSTKVRLNTSKCRRQWPAPAMIDSRDSLAPCRKNSSAMAALVNQPKPTATCPLAGSKLASSTTPIRVRVKLSGKKRGRVIGIIRVSQEREPDSNAPKDCRLTLVSQ
ncbi:hypothetical protein D3C71_693650 [compost metagenome]